MARDITEVRRANIRGLIAARGGLTKLSKDMGYSNPSFLSQMTGPAPSREISEKTARKIEKTLALAPGYLDTTHEEKSAPRTSQAPARGSGDEIAALAADVIRLVGRACADEAVSLGPDKFSDVVALVLADSFERGKPQPERVKQMLRLLK